MDGEGSMEVVCVCVCGGDLINNNDWSEKIILQPLSRIRI